MDEFWTGFWTGIFAWVAFWWLVKKALVATVLHVAKEQIAELKQAEADVLLKLEKHGDMLYCYRKDNDEFVGQAKSLEEIAELFKKKYPNQNARIMQEDSAGMMKV